jgi:RNA-dependent RNA polymerase
MILEDRRIPADVFLKIQADAIDEVKLSQRSIAAAGNFLIKHSLGKGYRLSHILEKLGSLGLELEHENPGKKLDNKFLLNSLRFAEFHVTRDIKHRARIPVKESHVLVGIADEGPAYKSRKDIKRNIYCLPQGSIYACVQDRQDLEPRWLEGPCLISRNPVVHPGDSTLFYFHFTPYKL